MKTCNVCNKENRDEAKFCISCGSKFILEQKEEEDIKENIELCNYCETTIINQRTSLDKVALILGLISIGVLVLMGMFPIAIIVSPIAIIISIVAMTKLQKGDRKKAVIGLVFGIIAFVISILCYIFLPIIINEISILLDDFCSSEGNSDICEMIKSIFPNLI